MEGTADRTRARIELLDGDASWSEVEPLTAAVYPAEVAAQLCWRDVEWSHAARRVFVREAGVAVATAGIYVRDGVVDGVPARIAGLGGVMTRPDRRGRGLASAAISRAQEAFTGEFGADFALLFCEPEKLAFYGRRGWALFDGTVLAEQGGDKSPFTVMPAMVREVQGPCPTGGTIDICGLPW